MRIHKKHPKRGARRQWRKSTEPGVRIRPDKTDDDGERITTNALRSYCDRYASLAWRRR